LDKNQNLAPPKTFGLLRLWISEYEASLYHIFIGNETVYQYMTMYSLAFDFCCFCCCGSTSHIL